MGLPNEVNSLFAGSADSGPSYKIERSLRFNSAAPAYMARTPTVAGDRKVWTFSAWLKRSEVTLTANYNVIGCSPDSLNRSLIIFDTNNSDQGIKVVLAIANVYYNVYTTTAFRDPTAWYHVVVSVDTTQSTAATRCRIYVNGVQQTVTGDLGLNRNTFFNSVNLHRLGAETYNTTNTFEGYMAEVYWLDGVSKVASDFGEYDAYNVWSPKAYTGTYGTNGFYLPFTNTTSTTTLGNDSSGNGNNYTPTGFSVTTDTSYSPMYDSPSVYTDGTNPRGNYCILNQIDPNTTATLANGGLQFTSATVGHKALGTFAMTTGKWYWEARTSAGTTQAQGGVFGPAGASAYYSFAANATDYGFRFDADAGTLDYTTNGTSWTSLATGLTSGPYFPVLNNNGTTSKIIYANFGQRPFTYSLPAGYKALSTYNMYTPSILKGGSYFAAVTYTGTGTTQNVTNAIAMSPTMVWTKARSGTTSHALVDSVRGAQLVISPDVNTAETTVSNSITAFNANGFTAGGAATTNASTVPYVGWQWAEGATPGFDIVTYTGTGVARTVSHNLGAVPKMMMIKNRSAVGDWVVYHQAMGNTQYMILNGGAAPVVSSTAFNNTTPTSTVFSVGTLAAVNGNTNNIVAYLWSEVPGFSRFGSWTGNGLADGPFVWCGFRPAFVMFKNYTAANTNDWNMYDSARDPQNLVNLDLVANTNGAEITQTTANTVDFLSNGFKLRTADGGSNVSGSTYLFMAFAENPFKIARAY